MMCEWLSSEEWCDVQLLCGGRIFNAHRVVLASVSSFLRKTLLSCPTEDSPAFIILPDFDFDALSSVLYYIYHGKDIIPQCRLKTFLEIIRIMQIYIDHQYLSKISEGMENLHSDLGMYREHNLPKSDDTTCLDSVNNEGRQYANLKRGVEIEGIVYKVQCSLDGLDYRDTKIRRCSWSENIHSSAVDLKLRCENRQRGSFLRDLFIETYAQNGNGNGLTPGVLTMSNERYRGPTSVLFTNANDRHPNANDTLSKTSKIESELKSHTSPTSHNSVQPIRSFYLPMNCPNEFCTESIINIYNKSNNDSKLSTNHNKQNFTMKNFCVPGEFNKNTLLGDEYSTLDLRITPRKCKEVNSAYEKAHDCEQQILETNVLEKGIILNEVIQSPWCPRKTYYYKPYRRKSDDTLQLKNQFDYVNDKNNNINVLSSTESTEKKSKCEIRDASATLRSLRQTARNEWKCTICNQVFTSNQSFTSHMRRHSAVSRYNCDECFKTFSQLRNYKYHMSVHRGTKEFATTCPICGKYFNDRGYLSSHMKIHRNRKEYKCSICPKSFNQRVAYNMHVRIHTGVKPHVCGECGKAFSRKMLLKQHQRTHSGERPYACSHCDKRFADRSNMTLHLRLHTGIKPFSCSLCSKSFTKKHHLKSHMNFHSGSKPYSCPECNLAFTQSSNMRTHFKKCCAPGTSAAGT